MQFFSSFNAKHLRPYIHGRDRFYVCSTVERAEQFGRNPKVYLDGVSKIVHQMPCLQSLLRIRGEDELPPKVGTKLFSIKFKLGRQVASHRILNCINRELLD